MVKKTKLFELERWYSKATVTLKKHVPNIKTCENGWSNFSENLRPVAIKMLELTLFASPNLSYFNPVRFFMFVVILTFLN